MSLKDIKESTFPDFLEAIAELIRQLYSSHQYLLQSEKLTQADKKLFTLCLENAANKAQLGNSIKTLSKLLHKHFDQPVYILIGEYDTPMNFAFHDAVALNKITKFMKTLLGRALNGNEFLKKALMTGILRLSKNSMLSDLNNLKVYSSLLFYAGYLKVTEIRQMGLDYACQLEITNEEVKCVYRSIFREWLENKVGDSNYQSSY